MNGVRSAKYMNLLTTISMFIGFPMIIWYSVFGGSFLLPIIGVVLIFVGRLIGYGIDRIIDLKEEKK